MANSTLEAAGREYPYVKALWQDQSGGYRWTISNDLSIILTATLTLMLAYALGRLLWIVYILMHFSFLDAKRKTFVDDQVSVIAINTESPSALLMFLLHHLSVQRRHAYRSIVFQVVALIAFVFWLVQIMLIVLFGRLFLNDPIPYSPGVCGAPIQWDNSTAIQGALVSHRFSEFEVASVQFSKCTTNANTVTCPAPAGQTFSFQVLESKPDYCWFGSQYCYNNSRSISLQATITPKDLGTLRNSPMSLSFMTECSHVNNTDFIRRVKKEDHYEFGELTDQKGLGLGNTSFIVFENEPVMNTGYRLEYIWSIGTNEEAHSESNWNPSPFLAKKRNSPFATDNTTAPSSITLLFNRLFGVSSSYPNDDPFFLTETTPHDEGRYLTYLSGQPVATLACHDRYRLEIAPTSATEGLTATGTLLDIESAWRSYSKRINSEIERRSLKIDYYMLTWNLRPTTIYTAVNNLGLNALRAQRTLLMPGLQEALPQNVNTKIEVTRWFGVTVLNILNSAYILTSGTDNNWDFGIRAFPDNVWVCDSTLRFSSEYTSVKLFNLVTILLLIFAITVVSYGLQPLFGYCVYIIRRKPWSYALEERFVSLSLHGLLQ
jgi:hypothetical protein